MEIYVSGSVSLMKLLWNHLLSRSGTRGCVSNFMNTKMTTQRTPRKLLSAVCENYNLFMQCFGVWSAVVPLNVWASPCRVMFVQILKLEDGFYICRFKKCKSSLCSLEIVIFTFLCNNNVRHPLQEYALIHLWRTSLIFTQTSYFSSFRNYLEQHTSNDTRLLCINTVMFFRLSPC